jgi:hypothetical protein
MESPAVREGPYSINPHEDEEPQMPGDAELLRLLDERAILAVLHRFCRGIDRLDEELVRSCYHEDATDDHGIYHGSGVDFAAFVVPVLGKAFTATHHFLGQSIIEFDEERFARAETYVIAHHTRRDGEGGEMLESVGARYVDRLEKRAGEWKLSHRVVLYEWSSSEPVRSNMPTDPFARGSRSKEDPAYG